MELALFPFNIKSRNIRTQGFGNKESGPHVEPLAFARFRLDFNVGGVHGLAHESFHQGLGSGDAR